MVGTLLISLSAYVRLFWCVWLLSAGPFPWVALYHLGKVLYWDLNNALASLRHKQKVPGKVKNKG